MTGWTLHRTRLLAGRWEGVLAGPAGVAAHVAVTGPDGAVGPARVEPDGEGRWTVTVDLPATLMSDGVQTLVFAGPGGETLLVEPMVFGDALDGDLRAGLASLRAEFDVLKRAFRRHLAEGD